MSERVLEISKEQADALRELVHASQLAQERMTLAFTMVLRGHGIVEASNPSLTDTTLTVTVPD